MTSILHEPTVLLVDGPPGSGKTSLARALIERWDRPMVLWDLDTGPPEERWNLRGDVGLVPALDPAVPPIPHLDATRSLTRVPSAWDAVIVLPGHDAARQEWFAPPGRTPVDWVLRWAMEQQGSHAMALVTTGALMQPGLEQRWGDVQRPQQALFRWDRSIRSSTEQATLVIVWQQDRVLRASLAGDPSAPGYARRRL